MKNRLSLWSVGVLGLVGYGLLGCSNDTDPEPATMAFGNASDVQAAADLWNRIKDTYKTWSAIPGQDGIIPSAQPHESYAQIFVNATGGNGVNPPVGSILVKENLTDMTGTIGALTVMERREGFNPSGYDWFWAKYTPAGMLTTTADGTQMAGAVAGCIGCHGPAGGPDFVVTAPQ